MVRFFLNFNPTCPSDSTNVVLVGGAPLAAEGVLLFGGPSHASHG